jgi:hypothetical protein
LHPSRPSAERVLLDSFVIVFFWRAPACAFVNGLDADRDVASEVFYLEPIPAA